MPTSEDDRPVRRCVCADTTFAELKRQGVRSLEDAADHGCGVRCGLCLPYLSAMIATGETEFEIGHALG